MAGGRRYRPVRRHLTPEIRERFWKKVKRGGEDECWLWQGALSGDGRGLCYITGVPGTRYIQKAAAHVAWTLEHEMDLPEGLVLKRTCDGSACVNPAHHEVSRLPGRRAGALTDAQVREIRERAGEETLSALAREYGVTSGYVGVLVYGHARRDAGGPIKSERELVLTDEQVREIRARKGKATGSELAREYGVNRSTIGYILRGVARRGAGEKEHRDG